MRWKMMAGVQQIVNRSTNVDQAMENLVVKRAAAVRRATITYLYLANRRSTREQHSSGKRNNMIEVAGVAIAFGALVWPIIVFLWGKRSEKQEDAFEFQVASLKPAPRAPKLIANSLIQDSRGRCNICWGSDGVALYFAGEEKKRVKVSNKDLVYLCENCVKTIRKEKMPIADLQLLKKHRMSLAQAGMKSEDLASTVEELYSDAIRSSLQDDPDSILKAIMGCEVILKKYDPFHAKTRILLSRLKGAEARLKAARAWESESDGDFTAYSIGYSMTAKRFSLVLFLLWLSVMLIWLIFSRSQSSDTISSLKIFVTSFVIGFSPLLLRLLWKKAFAYFIVSYWVLVHLIVHEMGHLFGAYITRLVVNVYGERMPFLRMIRFIEIDDQSFNKGIPSAIEKNMEDRIYIPSGRVNLNRMIREWRSVSASPYPLEAESRTDY